MAKKKRMPVNILTEQPETTGEGSALDDIVAGRAGVPSAPAELLKALPVPSRKPPALPREATETPIPRSQPQPVQAPPRSSSPPAGPRPEPTGGSRLSLGEDIAAKRILVAALVGLLPWPLLALIALTALHLETVHSLAENYRLPFERDFSKGAIAGFLAAVLAVAVGRAGADLLRFLPLAGPLLGWAFRAASAAVSSYFLSQLFLRNHEAGGTLLSRDPRATAEYFRERFHGESANR